MTDWILAHEPAVRLGVFASVFLAMAVAEVVWVRRPTVGSKGKRWGANWMLVIGNTLLVRLLFPVAAVGVAATAADAGFGLLPALGLDGWPAVVLGVVLLDLAIYVQHVVFHRVPLLWRLHRVHHMDVDLDVTSGARFHPVEIVLSMGIKVGVVAMLGVPPVAVVVFEVILNGMAMFNHANVRLPAPVDGAMRLLLVTPDVHRVHHSVHRDETNTNFGFNLSVWDRLFGTYRADPRDGHEAMVLGVDDQDLAAPQPLWWLVAVPFLKDGRRPPGGVDPERTAA